MNRYDFLRERSGETPLLSIIVGESGAGKTTFSNFVDRPEGYYSSSGAIEQKLAEAGIPIGHDTIHAYAQEAYEKDPYWQVPIILGCLASKSYLLLDGPRRVQEVEALREQYPNAWMIRISTSPELRSVRLQDRDGVSADDFARIVSDESRQLEIERILDMADETVVNDGDIAHLQSRATEFRELLDKISEDKKK
jgi:dephospho-CoA kinase